MKTLAILAQKGGSGKSTIAVHLAAYARYQKIRPALIDLDPQGSAYDWNQGRAEDDPHSPRLDFFRARQRWAATFAELKWSAPVETATQSKPLEESSLFLSISKTTNFTFRPASVV